MTRSCRCCVLLVLIVGIVGCTSDSKPRDNAEEQNQRAILNEGYSLLYSEISSVSKIHWIFLVKVESKWVKEVTEEVTDHTKALKITLEDVAKNYPAVNIEGDPLCVMEKRTRDALKKDRILSLVPVFGLTGESFDRRVLQTFEGTLNHIRFLCKVLAEEEPEPSLKQILTHAQVEFDQLYARVLGLLQERYYINKGEHKAK